MAVESKRGCGYRKVGGLYIVGGGIAKGCGRLPLPLQVCRACGGGIKQTRGWTWINPSELFAGIECRRDEIMANPHMYELDCETCPIAEASTIEKAGLLWIGKSFYPTPGHFIHEGNTLGICRRIKALPTGFEIGKTWVFLAHSEVMSGENDEGERVMIPGVFRVWCPDAIEKIVTETEAKDKKEMAKLEKRGITPVSVPDDDTDHQGSVHKAKT